MIIKLEKNLNKQESASYQVLQTLDKMPFIVILDTSAFPKIKFLLCLAVPASEVFSFLD